MKSHTRMITAPIAAFLLFLGWAAGRWGGVEPAAAAGQGKRLLSTPEEAGERYRMAATEDSTLPLVIDTWTGQVWRRTVGNDQRHYWVSFGSPRDK